MLTNQKENLDIESGLIQFGAFSMQPSTGLQYILACIHTSTCLPEQTSSLRSKHFHMSSLRKLGREQTKRNDGGRGRGEKETLMRKPHDFEKMRLPTNAASDWCSAGSVG